jgi:hypothetical protein
LLEIPSFTLSSQLMLYIGMSRDVAASAVSTGPTAVPQLQQQVAPASKSPASTPARIRKDKVHCGYTLRVVLVQPQII